MSLAVTAAIFLVWRRGLPGFTSFTPQLPGQSSATNAVETAAQSAVLVGFLVSPAVFLAGPKRLFDAARARAPRTTVVAGFLTALALGGEVAQHQASAQFLGPGNYVSQYGTGDMDTVDGTRHLLIPRSLLALLALVGIVAAVLLVLAAVPPALDTLARLRQMRPGTPASPPLAIIALTTVGYGLACVLPAAFGLVFYDRYLLPLVPLIGVLVLREGGRLVAARRGSRIFSGVALLALAAAGLTYAANSASFDGTKWRVAEEAAKLAGGPSRVNGGFEWTDYHAGKEILGKHHRDRPVNLLCIVLLSQSRPSGTDLLAAPVWGPTGSQTWIVARQRHPCGASPIRRIPICRSVGVGRSLSS